MSRLPDDLLDSCRCDPAAPFAQDPERDFGLDKQRAQQALAELRPWLNRQQRMLWANRNNALLLILQGTDCSGKDGVIRRVISSFDPQGLRIHSFQKPDACEQRHDFLWRYQRRLPTAGLLGVFNRSYYEGLISDPLEAAVQRGRTARPAARHPRLRAAVVPPIDAAVEVLFAPEQGRAKTSPA
jgi:polyphosphate kinase 2 (PPK2 family)